jgi:hypothetical protein
MKSLERILAFLRFSLPQPSFFSNCRVFCTQRNFSSSGDTTRAYEVLSSRLKTSFEALLVNLVNIVFP